jgi:iron complex transport system substrate-binding protein
VTVTGSAFASAQSPSASPGGTRTVEHGYGITEVPVDPQRVVSVGYETQELLLNFGVVPVLQRDYTGNQPDAVWPWAQPLLNGAHPATFNEEMPFETIAAAQPDLIVSINGGLDEAAYARLSEIAPTIPHPVGGDPWGSGSWEESLTWVGQILGQEDMAATQIADIHAQIEAIKAAHPEWAGKEAVSVTNWDALYVDTTHSRGQLLEQFGFTVPDEFKGEGANQLTYEEIARLDRDVILWVNGDDDATPFVDLKLRDTLTAHAEGREVYVDKYLTQAFTNQSPAAWDYVFKTLVPLLEAAMDGDPATPVSSSVDAGIAP